MNDHHFDPDRLALYEALAEEMNRHPERYEVLGDVDVTLGVVVTGEGAVFAVRLGFHGITCDEVAELAPGEEQACDCWLEGDLAAWTEMFADIRAHGRATGRHTINSLTLLGDAIRARGSDPLGVDRFFRFNQTIQSFFDGAAHLPALAH